MSTEPAPVVILDTGVLLQAALNPRGPAGAVVELLDQDRIAVYISPRLRMEVEEVFSRPSIRASNPQMTDAQIEEGLRRLDAKALMVPDPPNHFVYERDPDDETLISLAMEVQASFLVSRDRDLLDLMDDAHFRRRYPDLTILDPPALLRALPL